MQRKTNCRRRWLFQLDVSRLPTTIEQLPTVRYLCYNTATGYAYAELSDSRTKVHLRKLFGPLRSVLPKPMHLAREDAVAGVDPDVQLGLWNRTGQGCRSDLISETTETDDEETSAAVSPRGDNPLPVE